MLGSGQQTVLQRDHMIEIGPSDEDTSLPISVCVVRQSIVIGWGQYRSYSVLLEKPRQIECNL